MGKEKKRIYMLLLLFVTMGTIALFFGISAAQTGKQAVVKIQEQGKEATEPASQPGEEQSKTVATKPKPKKDKEETPYSYDPTNKPDPFKSFITVREELEEKKAREKPKTYLETLDISQLAISAIVLTDSGNWALVRDSKGDGHVIKVGTPIGRRRGRVSEIRETSVVVRESYKDFRGREIVRDRIMKLPTSQ